MTKTLILTFSILTLGFGGVVLAGSQLDLSSIEQAGNEMVEDCGLPGATTAHLLHGRCDF